MVGPIANWGFEDHSLVVALALTLGFDAVCTGWALLTALDAALATCQATSLGSLAHLGSGCRA